MLLVYYLTYYIIINVITQAHSPDTSHLSTINDHQHQDDGDDRHPALGMNESISYFKSFHFEWNNANEWTWSSSHNHSMNINESIACSKQNPSLCIHTQFTTNTITKQIQSFKSLTIHYKDTPFTRHKIALDFWNDLDWSQVNIIHHHDTNDVIDRRHLLSGALTAKYDNIYYMYDDDNDEDDFDEIEDMYNIDNDYDEFLGGLMKKLKSGLNTLKGALGGRIGVYARPPCSYKSRCRVHLYGRTQFRKRLNKYGHFCEGRWDRWRLKKYHVKQRKSDQMFQKPPHGSVSSVKVQGSPCCVMIAYDKYKFKGKRQGMFPRGRYPSMRMGIATSRDTRPREITEMDKRNDGFKNDALRSMVIVHDCYLRQKLMRRAIGRATRLAMPGPMQEMMQMMMQMKVMFPSKHKHHLGPRKHRPTYAEIARAQQKQLQQMMHSMMSSSMANQAPIAIPAAHRRRMIGRGRLGEIQGLRQTMQMMQMAKMMFPNAHRLHHHHRYWRHHRKSYAQIARDQQHQMQQMMHMMMMSAMANQAPITIPSRRRIMGQGKMNNMHVVGVKKCKLLYLTEICVTFDVVNSRIAVDYTVKDRREIKVSDGVKSWQRMESLVELFGDVLWSEIGCEKQDEMDMNMDPDLLDSFLDRIISQDTTSNETFGLKLDAKELEALETKHRMQLFMGPVNYGMMRNDLIFFDDFGYDLDLSVPIDDDMIDYFDTFVLESQNANDWMAMTNTSDKCNDVVLSHISYWICVTEKGLIYFERHEGTNDTLYDESLQLFHGRTHAMINEELDQTKLNMMNDGDWSEVYAIQQQGEERKKLCDYVSMMKLCVEGESNHFNITIQYLSDEVSKQMIRQANEIFSEWMF